ncbi:MAG: hypothetical protein ABI790_17975 [Betaproteobacteria bacterium]
MNLDVLIPSLLLPQKVHALIPSLTVPALERLLSRADRRVGGTLGSGASWLCECWGISAPYPLAPLLAEFDGLFDGPQASSDGWMFAEPVHLVASRDRLTLFPTRFLDLTSHETAHLIAALNAHFSDRHLQFYSPTTERWYVRFDASEVPDTTPPSMAHTGSLADLQPKSKGAIDWRALQNEAQMLLFGHPINEAREAVGKPTVSGVWFWGGGVLPVLKKPYYDRVVADTALPSLLANKTGIELRALSWESIRSATGSALAVLDSCTELASKLEFEAWVHEMERLERELFLPISRALTLGDIQHLDIHSPGHAGTHSFSLTRRNHLLRFWRPAKPLSAYA